MAEPSKNPEKGPRHDASPPPSTAEAPLSSGEPAPTTASRIRHGAALVLMAATPFLLLAAFFILDGFIR